MRRHFLNFEDIFFENKYLVRFLHILKIFFWQTDDLCVFFWAFNAVKKNVLTESWYKITVSAQVKIFFVKVKIF